MKTSRQKLYDVKCGELAEHFLSDNASTSMSLSDEARKAESLAIAIQEAVEDWFAMEEPAVRFHDPVEHRPAHPSDTRPERGDQ